MVKFIGLLPLVVIYIIRVTYVHGGSFVCVESLHCECFELFTQCFYTFELCFLFQITAAVNVRILRHV